MAARLLGSSDLVPLRRFLSRLVTALVFGLGATYPHVSITQ